MRNKYFTRTSYILSALCIYVLLSIWQVRAENNLPFYQSRTDSVETVLNQNLFIPQSVFVVNTTGDNSDALPGDGFCNDGGGNCSLRAAIQEANAFAGANIIDFAIPDGCLQTILPSSALPAITESVTINGYSQSGATTNTAATGSNATICVQLDGLFAGGFVDGLRIDTSGTNTTIRGLAIYRFGGEGIEINGNGAIIEGNFVGTDNSNAIALPNFNGISVNASNARVGGSTLISRNIVVGNSRYGIAVSQPATGATIQNNNVGLNRNSAAMGNGNSGILFFRSGGNTVGGTTSNLRNVISSNGTSIGGGFDGSGIYILGDTLFSQAPNNTIQGNYIGTNATGTGAIANATNGIRINGAINTTIGGAASGAGNLISGNASDGVIIEGTGATGNLVRGNTIGLDITRINDLGNTNDGVEIVGVGANTIGGENAGEGNFIGGNNRYGVHINSANANNNIVQGNTIGMNLTGTPRPQDAGVLITTGTGNQIGGTTTGARNYIGGNSSIGVGVAFATNNTIQGNWVGLGVSGLAVPNTSGVYIQDAANNTIGGTAPGAGNVVSGNQFGIRMIFFSVATTGNVIQGNLIGTDPFGTSAVANNIQAVLLQGANANTIGGTIVSARNVISGNNQGISLQNNSPNNIVQGNFIGTKIDGLTALPNTLGIQIDGSGSTGNVIGGTATGAGNVISGNLQNGLQMSGGAASNRVEGNIVGLKADGSAALPNSNGISLFGLANNNVIGGTAVGAGNIISGNTNSGVVFNDGANNNRIEGNKIGTDATGNFDLGNGLNGIRLLQGSIMGNNTTSNIIGGTTASARNLVSGNNNGGILVQGTTTTNNTIAGNYIGTNNDGDNYLQFAGGGITSNFLYGIRIDAPNNFVGGATTAHRNLISGQFQSNDIGVQILNTATGTLVQNNYIGTTANGNGYLFNGLNIVVSGSNFTIDSNLISGALYGINIGNVSSGIITNNKLGTDAAGTSFLGNGFSIYVQNSSNVKIGEDSGGNVAPNIIAGGVGDGRAGITIIGNGTGNLIRQNSIYENAGIGIDLGGDGVTQNDSGDPDLANNLQNFPSIDSITTTINGKLNSTPNRSFRIEFYTSTAADPTGYGEGKTFITNTVVVTDGAGNATFSLPNPIPVGGYISATATDLITNDTSEFSAYKQVLAPTAVRFAGAKATRFANGNLIKWETGFESDNLGFNVYRENQGKRELVNNSLVSGSALMTQARLQSGFNYQWFDVNAPNDTDYYIEAVDLDGTKEIFGAFSIEENFNQTFGDKNSVLISELNKTDTDKTVYVEEKVNSEEKHNDEQQQIQNALTRFDGVRLGVKSAGFYRISAGELFSNGLPQNANLNNLKLFADGIEQPIIVVLTEAGTLQAIEFYGIGIDSAETNLRNYLLFVSDSQGRRIERADIQGAPSSQTFYSATVQRKDRTNYFSGLLNGAEENFFGSTINNVGTESVLTLANVVQSGNAELFVKLQGLTRTSHNVQVEINGQLAGNISFEAQLKGTLQTQIPVNLLHEGANMIRFTALGGTNDLSLIEDIQLSFPREFRAQNNQIQLSVQNGQEVTVTGFSTKAVRVFDVTDANNIFEMGTRLGRSADVERSFTIGFTPNGNGMRKIFMTANASSTAEIAQNYSSDLRGANSADLVIITKRQFFKSFNPLIKNRQTQGLRVLTVDIQDIYDEFNFSQKSTQSVKNFLQFANANWQIKPRYVIFAGDASYDPKGYFGGNSDFVPTRLVDTLTMETASDEWFGDFDNDGVAEFAIGRIPGQNVSEISAMVSKIVGYDLQTQSNSAAFVSDVSDGFDFAGANTAVRQILPQSINAVNIERGETDDQTVRTSILNAINNGQKILTYVGHGSTGIWRGNIFTKTDAESLSNAGKLPVFVTMTCLNGYFHDALNTGLSETLMKNPNGGAVAVWTSTGAGLPDSYGSLNVEIHRQLLSGATLGEAHLRAKRTITNDDVLKTFVLLGDPSMRLR